MSKKNKAINIVDQGEAQVLELINKLGPDRVSDIVDRFEETLDLSGKDQEQLFIGMLLRYATSKLYLKTALRLEFDEEFEDE